MTVRLRVLWQWLLGTTPSRCADCGRRIWGGYDSDPNTPADQPVHRHSPACQTRTR